MTGGHFLSRDHLDDWPHSRLPQQHAPLASGSDVPEDPEAVTHLHQTAGVQMTQPVVSASECLPAQG